MALLEIAKQAIAILEEKSIMSDPVKKPG